MSKIPVITGKAFISFLESLGFSIVRKKGSHVRLKSMDGKFTTVPIHGNKDLPKGLLRKIIREDIEISLERFIELYTKFKSE